ncbi:MAG TPA: hypothetical protein PLE80_05440 [Opitutaceae bacterium]|nr:hypothetical protein [Opitutaceae bacterium]
MEHRELRLARSEERHEEKEAQISQDAHDLVLVDIGSIRRELGRFFAGGGVGGVAGAMPVNSGCVLAAAQAAMPSRQTIVSVFTAPDAIRALSSSVEIGPVWAPFFI